jgi:aspartyl protease family protein
MRLLWIVLAILGGGLLLLVINDDAGSTLGLANEQFGSLVYLGALGLVIGAFAFAGMRLGDVARNLAIWLLLIVLLVAGYQYRYELQDIASRMTAGLVPASPMALSFDGGSGVRIDRLPSGHFEVRGSIDGSPVRFLVDTGATVTVLTADDAQRAGIDVAALSFSVPVATANGMARAARHTVGELAVGGITRRGVGVMVAEEGRLSQSLLGMSFINSLSGFEMRGDRMILLD